jgi:hypothetical protein
VVVYALQEDAAGCQHEQASRQQSGADPPDAGELAADAQVSCNAT